MLLTIDSMFTDRFQRLSIESISVAILIPLEQETAYAMSIEHEGEYNLRMGRDIKSMISVARFPRIPKTILFAYNDHPSHLRARYGKSKSKL